MLLLIWGSDVGNGGGSMKKNSLSIIMVLLVGIGALNLMCFILKAASMSRITCGSIDQTIVQHKMNVIAIIASLIGIAIVRKLQIKNREASNDDHCIGLKEER